MGPKRAHVTVWGVAGLAASLFAAQTALADSDMLAARFVVSLLGIAGMALAVMAFKRVRVRDVNGPPPDPVSIVLGGLAALCLWAPAWWLMDFTDHRLNQRAGMLAAPQMVVDMSDALFGLDLQPVAYELEILFAVVLIPLVTAWLLWGLMQPELGEMMGRWRAAWVAGVVSGVFMTLASVQDVTPALPWGLASLGGYVVIGCAAALTVYLTGSPWTGFAAYSAFAYASFAWQDDLFRQFAGKDYWDVEWLTVIVLGLFGAMMCLQVIRFREPRPAEPERDRRFHLLRLGLPLALLLATVIVMAVIDLESDRTPQRATAAAGALPAAPSGPAHPAPESAQ
jgi:hypothetical protein